MKSQILVVAPSNTAVDMLAEKVYDVGLKVVRVCARNRESISTKVESFSLHNLIMKPNDDNKAMLELIDLKVSICRRDTYTF